MESTIKSIRPTTEKIHDDVKSEEKENTVDSVNEKQEQSGEEESQLETDEQKEELKIVNSYIKKLGRKDFIKIE